MENDTSCRNSLASFASQDSIEGVLNQFEFTHTIDEFELIKNGEGSSRVGDGGFSSVDKYRHEELGDVVIKKIRFRINNDFIQTVNTFESFSREVKALQRLSHENIVKFYGTTRVSDDVVGIIMEYVDGTSLQCLLKKQGSKLPWIVRFSIIYQISKVLKQLHRYKKNKWLVHSDLKPENILITDDWNVKLIDFGSINFAKTDAASQDSLDHLKSGQKTKIYAAPEILVCGNGNRVPAMDIYSYGMVIYEVLTGKEVYSDANCSRDVVLEAIKNGVRPNADHLDKIQTSLKVTSGDDDQVIFENLRSLAEACWEQNSENRPNIDEVAQSLEEIFVKVTGTEPDDFQLKTRVEQALLLMELEIFQNSLEESENPIEDISLVNLNRKLMSHSALDSRVYDMINSVDDLLMDRAINSKPAMMSQRLDDVRRAIDLWTKVPDVEKAEQGVKKCMDRWEALNELNTKFHSQVEHLAQTAQKAIFNRRKTLSPESKLQAQHQGKQSPLNLPETEVKVVGEKNSTMTGFHRQEACSSAVSDSEFLIIEQEEQHDEEGGREIEESILFRRNFSQARNYNKFNYSAVFKNIKSRFITLCCNIQGIFIGVSLWLCALIIFLFWTVDLVYAHIASFFVIYFHIFGLIYTLLHLRCIRDFRSQIP